MRKLLQTMAATIPALLLVLGSTLGTPAGELDALMIPTATGEEIDQVALDQWIVGSNWPAGAYSNVPLVAGRPYRIEITGAFTPDPAAGFQHDAECAWTSVTVGDRLDAADKAGTTNDVWVHGAEVDWVPTTPSPAGCNDLNHTYSVVFTPAEAGAVNLTVHDTGWYGDNSGNLTARLFTATASDPANPVEDAQELVNQVGGIVTETAEDAQEDVNTVLEGEGIDADDPEGTAERKQQEVFAKAGETITTAEEKKEEVESQLPDPDEVVGDVKQILEENDPGDPGGADPSPVTDAVDAVLDEVENIEQPEAPDDIPNPLPEQDPGGGDTSTTTTPSTSPPTTSPPTTAPPATSPPSSPPSNEGGSGGSGGSGNEATNDGSTPAPAASEPAPAPVTESLAVSDAPGPTADDGSADTADVTAAPAPSVRSAGSRSASGAPAGAATGTEPTVDGLMETELALGDLGDLSETDAETRPRPRPVIPEPATSGNRILMLGIAAGVLFGTFEMGRRALARIRAERAYDTYGYR